MNLLSQPVVSDPATQVDVDDLVRQHMPLVGHLVRDLHSRVPSHVDRDDLTGTGLAALVAAARAWDAERGVSFARYASIRVRGALLDELRGLDWASRSVRRRAREIDEARSRVAGQIGRNPTDAELSAATGLSLRELASHADDVSRSVVLSMQTFEDDQVDGLVSRRAPGADVLLEQREKMAYLRDAVDTLPTRLRTVVEGWFLQDRSMADIAADLGVSESRVSQMRAEALALLKDGMNSALAPEMVPSAARPDGCAARRRESYFAEVAAHRSFRERLAAPAPVAVAQSA
ncbi:sigma-70 family RNA polymerase sigma factor [Solicola sp. PLA-1-18]|uniref:sigma-70 family RNA polymerase sigma factor n=1 Tax=Solicola sp. PLA-1-18 TaxID=3380532 RepID=UPI003B80E2E4